MRRWFYVFLLTVLLTTSLQAEIQNRADQRRNWNFRLRWMRFLTKDALLSWR